MKCETKVFDTPTKFKNYLKTIKIMPLSYNRPINDKHVAVMTKSVISIGVQRPISVVVTTAFNKKGLLESYTSDAQHLQRTILECENKKLFGHMVSFENHIEKLSDIIPFVSTMNSTARNWNLFNYLNSWCNDEEKEDYRFIKELQKSRKCSLNALIEAYLGERSKGNKTFKDGDFKANHEIGDKILTNYDKVTKKGWMNETKPSFNAFVRYSIDNLDKIEIFVDNIRRNKIILTVDSDMTRDEFLTIFRRYCNPKGVA